MAGYSVGRYHRGRRPWLTLVCGAVILFVAAAIHDLRVPGQSATGSLASFYVVLLGALPMGRALQTRDLRAELAAAEAREARLAQGEAAHRAVEEERARIARELHDVAAHGASLIIVQSVAAQGIFESEPARARNALESIESEARAMLGEMRRLVIGIRPGPAGDSEAPGPPETLVQLVARVRAAGQPVEARLEPGWHLKEDLAMTVYRCVQEALTNAVKHAPGAETSVVARAVTGAIQIEVENGHSAQTPPASPNANGGRGLPGMRERVAAVGGSLAAGATPGGGFLVRVTFPTDGSAP